MIYNDLQRATMNYNDLQWGTMSYYELQRTYLRFSKPFWLVGKEFVAVTR